MNKINKLNLGGEIFDIKPNSINDLDDILSIEKGGTNADNYKDALANLHAAETTTETLTYYVDANNGSDDNNGLTEGTAFKTIQHAIDILPKVIFHQIIINCAEGTYEEDLIIEEFKGNGWLAIYGNNQDCSRHFINSLYCKNCSCDLIFQGWTVTKSQQIELTYYASIIANHCTECNFYKLDFPKKDTSLQNGKLGSAIVIRNSSTAVIGNISAYEQQYAILCIGASECQLGMISGSGNEFGYYAGNESYIIAQNTLPTDFATTKYQKITGGLVYAAGALVT